MATPTSSAEVDEVVALRDRILAGILDDRAAVLLQCDRVLANVRLGSGAQAVLVSCPPSAPADAVSAMFAALVRNIRGGVVHFVVVGASPSGVQAIERVMPSWSWRRRLALHAVDVDGSYRHVRGPRLALVREAVAAAPSATAPAPEELAARVERATELHEHEIELERALHRRFPTATAALGAACVVLFGLTLYWGGGEPSRVLYPMGANSGLEVRAGEYWRVLASAFLHANVTHLVVNMIALAAMGPMLEALLGWRRFLVLYTLAALGGGLASALLRAEGGFSVGASGAIWGLMAASVALALRPQGLLPPLRLALMRRRSLFPIAVNVAFSFTPGIDLYAHFGGGAVGALLILSGFVTRGVAPAWTAGDEAENVRDDATPQCEGPLWTAAAIAGSIAMAASVALAFYVGMPWRSNAAPELTPVTIDGFSVELPRSIAGSPRQLQDGGRSYVVFGDLRRVPIAVEVQVQTLPDAERDGFLRGLLDGLKTVDLGPTKLEGEPRMEPRGAHTFVVAHGRMETVALHLYFTVVGERAVALRVVARSDLPDAWAAVPDAIAASLRAEGGAPSAPP